eukprot:scaffold119744_cov17-Tisochrysis_lutea.AAC.1
MVQAAAHRICLEHTLQVLVAAAHPQGWLPDQWSKLVWPSRMASVSARGDHSAGSLGAVRSTAAGAGGLKAWVAAVGFDFKLGCFA